MVNPSKQIFCCVAILFVLAVPGFAPADNSAVGVLLSREISPYVSMVEGLESSLTNLSVQRFFLDAAGNPYSLGGQGPALDLTKFDAMVAVGPEAMRYLLPRVGAVPMVYGMVLNPESLVPEAGQPPCGVTLNLPIEAQLRTILHHLPDLARLGVLYDPANNQAWFDDASSLAGEMGVELIPLQVSKRFSRLELIGDLALPDAILFIPDRTIISRAVIQYVIKEAVLRRIPVVGYNQFFYDSGAALSFIIDYNKVGQQVAAQLRQLLAGEDCQVELAPLFDARINDDAWRVIGLNRATINQPEGLNE